MGVLVLSARRPTASVLLLLALCLPAGPAEATVITQADGWVYLRVPNPIEEVTDDPPPSSTPGTGALASAALHRTGADAQMSATANLGSVRADASASSAAGAHVKAFGGSFWQDALTITSGTASGTGYARASVSVGGTHGASLIGGGRLSQAVGVFVRVAGDEVFDARQVSTQLGLDPPFSQATLLRNELGTEVVTNPAQMFGTFTFDVPFTFGQPFDFIGAASNNPDTLTGLPGEQATAFGGASLSWNGFTSVRLPDGTLLPGFTVVSESGHDWGDSPIPVLRAWDEVVRDRQGLADAHREQLDLFVWPFSIGRTERPRIFVRSPEDFRLRVFRLGWYDGAGASLLYDSGPALPARNAGVLCGAQSSNPTVAAAERDFGLVECPWTNPVQPQLPTLRPGLYLAIVTATINGAQRDNAAVFVVRDDASTAPLVIVNPTNAQASSDWSDTPDADSGTGFRPLSFHVQKKMAGAVEVRRWPRASKVSFNRPMSTFGFFKADYPLIRFLEREGIRYSLATDYDLHARAGIFDLRRAAVISGQGEYWSGNTRTRLERFVAAGKNLVVMAGNTGSWQVRYESSPAGLPGPVIVGYQETALSTAPRASEPACADIIVPAGAASCGDPLSADAYLDNDRLVTTLFRNPPVNRPEQLLFGVQYQLAPGSNGLELPLTLHTDVLASMASLRSGIAPAGDQDIGVFWNAPNPADSEWLGNIGWDADVIHPHTLLRAAPNACLRVFGTTRWPWDGPVGAANQAHLVLYRPRPTSGHVVAGLGALWSWGLDSWAAEGGWGGPPISRVDPRLQTLTRNMLRAASRNSFAGDCGKPLRISYRFAKTAAGPGGVSLLLREGDRPGRWASVPVRSEGGGVFLKPDPSATADLAGWPSPGGAADLFTADVNADGLADLVAKERLAPGNWYVALNTNGAFEPQPAPWLSGWAVASDAYDLFAADVNADGRADLVAKERAAPGDWRVALGTGTAFEPQPAPWLSGFAAASADHQFFVADVNDDGRADLVARERRAPGRWRVALSTGTSFQAQPAPWLRGWEAAGAAPDLFAADVNGDGRADLAAKERTPPGRWFVALSTGTSFREQGAPWLTGWAEASSAHEYFVADITGDGIADLVARQKVGRGDWLVARGRGTSFRPQTKPLLAR